MGTDQIAETDSEAKVEIASQATEVKTTQETGRTQTDVSSVTK